ncbi:hypothetical protein CEXT_557631 [Caerostris extrusa]|uniref:Uncharacterized protein n=1 Tax=Caerostris extrusa TaxID=172846 RepID=A0AAV4TCI8_CAEEX|nr:hypothetical protein CEXT_557631 [Caerostris extrusa]
MTTEQQIRERHCSLDSMPTEERTYIGSNDILLTPRRDQGCREGWEHQRRLPEEIGATPFSEMRLGK